MTGAGSGGQAPPDGMDPEEAERCPICLCVLAGSELAMPDSCCHVFCLGCLLTWAELQVAPSCPVDRRPFTNVYRWDGDLSCVQVPVKRRPTKPESESCCCKKPEKVCLKKKPAKRIRRQKAEMTADTKSKGLVRKCNEEDPSSLTRKKMRGIECCVWSPSSCVSITASTQDGVWVTEDITSDTALKECKAQIQECPWRFLAAPADGILRQHLNPTTWNHSSFSFGHLSSPFTSSILFGPDHFVFQGVVCAITCPKGGEKRGGRASTSKAPPKEAESLPTRRSGRNSKTQEETPLSDASSPPQSNSSDCDSSAKLGRTSKMPARRKGKQVTNRKASGKRKAAVRRKSSPEVVNSSSASEEEGGGGDDGDEEEEITTAQNISSDQQQTDDEESLNADQDDFVDEQDGADSLNNYVAQDNISDTQEQSNEHAEEDKTDERRELPGLADSAANSPGPWSGGNQSKGEEQDPASPVSSSGKDSERNSPVPSDSQSALTENPMSPHCNDQTEQHANMEICMELEEVNYEYSSREMKAKLSENLAQPSSPSAGKVEENVADPDTKSSEGTHVKALGLQESSAGEVTKDNDLSKDDNEVIPMDCSSPTSEHGRSPISEPLNDCGDAVATGPPPSEHLLAKDESSSAQEERENSQERKNGRQRRSRFHSPSSTWSPKRDSKRDSSRRSNSRSREHDSSPPSSRSSQPRSRERGRARDNDREHSRRDRSRERRRWRSRSHSRSRSRSRSGSRSRTRSYRRGPSPEQRSSREHSPQRKERRGGWRSGQGSGFGGEGRRYHGGAGRFENGEPTDNSPDRQGWSENPDWVTEKTFGESEGRNKDVSLSGSSRWEGHRNSGGSLAEPRGQGGRGRGAGRGGGTRSFYNQQEETSDNRWQARNNFSGTSNNSGNDSYSRFNENRGGGRRKESEQGDSMLDRSGWSSASSWAVRRTLPADVQDYYSKRERGGPGGWNRQEEEQQPAAGDPPKSEPQPQAVPGNAPVPVVTVIPPHPPQLNVLPHHYPMQGPRGALPVTLQPAAPYAMPPQVPVHLHSAVPLFQIPAVGAQGLPPPPPPPPPMQQGSQTVAGQAEGHTTQMGTNIVSYGKPGLPTLTKAGIAAVTQGQPAPCQALPSSTTQPGHNKAQADSSKKEKKQQIQEKAINEVKTAIKPFYQKKEITKEEYKEIVRKAVEKVCHSKSGEVNSSKVANLVKAYVDKYKHARKK